MEIYTYMLCVCAIFSIEHHTENLDSELVSELYPPNMLLFTFLTSDNYPSNFQMSTLNNYKY